MTGVLGGFHSYGEELIHHKSFLLCPIRPYLKITTIGKNSPAPMAATSIIGKDEDNKRQRIYNIQHPFNGNVHSVIQENMPDIH